jgi:hypothetical protein
VPLLPAVVAGHLTDRLTFAPTVSVEADWQPPVPLLDPLEPPLEPPLDPLEPPELPEPLDEPELPPENLQEPRPVAIAL